RGIGGAMDFRDSPEEAAFRQELRGWLPANLPAGWSEATYSVACRADDDVDGWRLTGVKRCVPDAAAAEEAVVAARTGQGVGLFRLDLAGNRDTVHPLCTMDSTRRLAELRLDRTPAELLGDPDGAAAALPASRRRALALLA